METTVGNTFRGEYKIIRLIGSQLASGYIDLRMSLDFNPESTKAQQALALKSMKKWMSEILNGCVAFNTNSDFPTDTFEYLDNHMMFCPDEPYDFMLMTLIYAKLNAIGEGHIIVDNLDISSDISDGFATWIEGDPDTFLPSIVEWLGERRYVDKSWWNRADGGMIEMWVLPDDDDISITPDIFIPLNDVDITGIVDDLDQFSAEIIKPNFKPTIIKND